MRNHRQARNKVYKTHIISTIVDAMTIGPWIFTVYKTHIISTIVDIVISFSL